LTVWKEPPPDEIIKRSLAEYDAFYDDVYQVLGNLIKRHGKIVIFDLHSYNHRRQGMDAPSADPHNNPDVNVGTGTMDRSFWEPVVDRFMHDLAGFDFLGRRLDVRENIKFRGGNFSRWIHETFPKTACSLAIEVKKFFMDEWTGKINPMELHAVEQALRKAAMGVSEILVQL